MARYVVFGAGGQLGTELVHQLERRDHSVVGVDRETCDITTPEAVTRILDRERPEVVFNAAGFTLVDQAESVRSRALKVNGVGAAIVSAHARKVGARLVHFSSDYVFGPGHSSPIDEAREPKPMNVYGRSKLWGEELALRNNRETYVVRSSGMYSRFGRNVVRQMIEVAMSRKSSITMIDDEFVAPTPAYLVAQTAIDLAAQDVFGIFHASAKSECSWYEFVVELVTRLDLDIEIQPISQERWGAPAQRPKYSALDNLMLRTLGLDSFPTWDVALQAFLEENGERIIWEVA